MELDIIHNSNVEHAPWLLLTNHSKIFYDELQHYYVVNVGEGDLVTTKSATRALAYAEAVEC